MRRITLLLVLFFLFFNLATTKIHASFGISPADITFEYLEPGITVEKDFKISRTELDKEIRVEVEPNIPGADKWVQVEPGISFTMSPGQQTHDMKVRITIPEDAEYQDYEGFIIVKALEGGQQSGVSVVQGVGVSVNLITTNLEVTRLLVRNIEIPHVSQGNPIKVIINTENQGNSPSSLEELQLTIFDMTGNEIFRAETTEFEAIEPSQVVEIIKEFEYDLAPGEYRAEIVITFQGETLREHELVFKVVEGDGESEAKEDLSVLTKYEPFLVYSLLSSIVIGGIVLLIRILKKKDKKKTKINKSK